MSHPPAAGPRGARWIVALLALAAAAHLGYQLRLAAEPADAGPFETVLAQAVAGHFAPGAGPGRFYGPFGGDHPSVLMHAPLYYRLVALAAWPAVAAGVDPLAAALGAGRLVTLLGTLLLLAATYRLATGDGAPRRAGWLAAALAAASPLLGNLAVMVRPDTLGVGLQTLGAVLALGVLRDGPAGRPARRLAGAALAFAAAFCVKQQDVTVAAVVGVLVLAACLRGRLPWRVPLAAAGAGIAFVAADLVIENALTGGRMWRAVFVYPSGPFRALNYAGWGHVASVLDITARRLLAPALVAGAAAWAVRGARGGRRDAVVLAMLAVELAALVPLCLFNAGATWNYALQAVVCVGVLVGRLLDRALAHLEQGPLPWRATAGRLGPLAAAVALLALADAYWLRQTERIRAGERAALAALRAAGRHVPDAARYFAKRQDLNRLCGNRALIHDDWLYDAFERAAGAEPRARWLGAALAAGGPIRQVVVLDDEPPAVPGVPDPLPALGYRPAGAFGRWRVWERAGEVAPAPAAVAAPGRAGGYNRVG